MTSDFRYADFDALARLWRETHPPRYAVDAHLLRINTVESPLFDWGLSVFYGIPFDPDAFVAIKRSASPALYGGYDPDAYHLSAIAFRDPNVGVDLLARVKETLRDRGATTLTFGQDSRHFWPGCPMDSPRLHDFLMVEGFEEDGEVWDVERSLADYANTYPVPEGFTAAPMKPEDRPALEEFLAEEFPGRWQFDVLHKLDNEPDPSFVHLLWRGGHVVGFAMTQDSGCQLPIGGAVWRQSLGGQWGGLGPIGVSENIRGLGGGISLLGEALASLQRRGVDRCLIDWTTLVDFYGRHGFVPERRYRPMTLRL